MFSKKSPILEIASSNEILELELLLSAKLPKLIAAPTDTIPSPAIAPTPVAAVIDPTIVMADPTALKVSASDIGWPP
jgi:hypothetical protein